MGNIKSKMKKYYSFKTMFISFVVIGILFTAAGLWIFDYVKKPTKITECELTPTEEIISGPENGGIVLECNKFEPNPIGDFAVENKVYYVFLPFLTLSVLFNNSLIKILLAVANIAYFMILGFLFSLLLIFIKSRIRQARTDSDSGPASKKEKRKKEKTQRPYRNE